MQTVILAGGKGTRLFPITEDVPKPMVLVKGIPFLEYLLLLLKRNSLKEILLCVGYRADAIEAYFGDGRRWGMEIKYSYEKELLGTGGALKLAEGLIKEKFLLLYGDSYLNIDYGDFIDFFKNHRTIGATVIYDNAMGDTDVRNNIAVDGNLITKYDKNQAGPSLKYVEAGVSIFKKELLNLIARGRRLSLENDIFPILIENKQLLGYKNKTRFFDIGTRDRLNYFEDFNFKR